MAAFAVVFAHERFQADGAHYLLHIMQSESFRIEHQRFILAFSQLLPVAGIKLGLSANVVIILNSLNNVVYFFGLFLLAVRYLNDRKAGIAIILSSVLGVLHIQFIPMYEIWYGIPLVILLFSFLQNNRVTYTSDVLLFYGIMITALFSHPLIFIPVLFVLLYDYTSVRQLRIRTILTTALVFTTWYVSKKLMLTEYESGKMSMLDTGWNKAYENLLHFHYYLKLGDFFFTWYTIPSVMLCLSLIYFFLNKSWLKLFTVMGFWCGHILLINFTHVNDPVLSPYFERMYMPLLVFSLIPFLYDVSGSIRMNGFIVAFILVAVIAWRFFRFTELGLDYKKKTQLAEELIRNCMQQKGSKFVMNDEDYHSCFSFIDWSFPMETMIRSSAMNKSKSISVVTSEDMAENQNSVSLQKNQFLFRRWEIMNDESANHKYFNLKSGAYVQLPPMCQKITSRNTLAGK
ncbi:MAG: hypothetical protein Fur0041_14320 [Bacteroidia bacterium]